MLLIENTVIISNVIDLAKMVNRLNEAEGYHYEITETKGINGEPLVKLHYWSDEEEED